MSGDVEGVHGYAFFGADAGVGGIESGFIDGVEKIVEEADAVEGLDLDGGASGVEIVGNAGADGDGEAGFGAGFEKIDFPFEVVFRLVVLGLEDGGEGVDEAIPRVGVRNRFEVSGANAEHIEHNVVGASEEVCGEDVDLFRGEGAAEFFEEEWAVTGRENEGGVAFVWVVGPFHTVRMRGFAFLFGE